MLVASHQSLQSSSQSWIAIRPRERVSYRELAEQLNTEALRDESVATFIALYGPLVRDVEGLTAAPWGGEAIVERLLDDGLPADHFGVVDACRTSAAESMPSFSALLETCIRALLDGFDVAIPRIEEDDAIPILYRIALRLRDAAQYADDNQHKALLAGHIAVQGYVKARLDADLQRLLARMAAVSEDVTQLVRALDRLNELGRMIPTWVHTSHNGLKWTTPDPPLCHVVTAFLYEAQTRVREDLLHLVKRCLSRSDDDVNSTTEAGTAMERLVAHYSHLDAVLGAIDETRNTRDVIDRVALGIRVILRDDEDVFRGHTVVHRDWCAVKRFADGLALIRRHVPIPDACLRSHTYMVITALEDEVEHVEATPPPASRESAKHVGYILRADSVRAFVNVDAFLVRLDAIIANDTSARGSV